MDPTRWRDGLGRWLAQPLVLLLVLSALGLGVATLFGWGFAETYEAVVNHDGIAGFDQPVLTWMVATRVPWWTLLVNGFTQTGGPIGMPTIAVVGTGILLWASRSLRPAILTIVAAGGSLAMTVAIKALVGRPRPPLVEAVPPYESSASFPSGHTLNATVVVGILVYSTLLLVHTRRARTLAVAIGGGYVLAIGLSRVYLGHHWLSDVIGAWFLGLAWLVLVIVAHQVARAYGRGRRSDPVTDGPSAPWTDPATADLDE